MIPHKYKPPIETNLNINQYNTFVGSEYNNTSLSAILEWDIFNKIMEIPYFLSYISLIYLIKKNIIDEKLLLDNYTVTLKSAISFKLLQLIASYSYGFNVRNADNKYINMLIDFKLLDNMPFQFDSDIPTYNKEGNPLLIHLAIQIKNKHTESLFEQNIYFKYLSDGHLKLNLGKVNFEKNF